MNKEIGYSIIIGVCLLILIIGLLRKKAEIVINFLLRIVLGMIGIYLVNLLLASQGIHYLVGLNPVSAVTVGVLGIPGVLLLYGIEVVSHL